MTDRFEAAHEAIGKVEAQFAETVYLTEIDRRMLVGTVCLGSSVLFEGVPGTGKTTIAKTAATVIGGEFRRVQGTPDLMPTSITGNDIYVPNSTETQFRNGPVFTDVLLVDEFNRMSPQTQSALLEAMEEKQVTVGNKTHKIGEPLITLATQNPFERTGGTYKSNFANLDRFAISVELPPHSERVMLAVDEMSGKAEQTIDLNELLIVRDSILTEVKFSPEVALRAARMVVALRELSGLVDARRSNLGGQRPFDALKAFSKVLAIQEKERMVRDEHIDIAADYVFPHRIVLDLNSVDVHGEKNTKPAIAEAKRRVNSRNS